MPLNNFFHINLPYGMSKNKDGEWLVFNREYCPLGFNTRNSESCNRINGRFNLPIYSKYSRLTDATIEKIMGDTNRSYQSSRVCENGGSVQYDDAGKINRVFFYNDLTDPVLNPQTWVEYFKKLKAFSSFYIGR